MTTAPATPSPLPLPPAKPLGRARRRRRAIAVAGWVLLAALAAAAVWGGARWLASWGGGAGAVAVPTAQVRRGDVRIEVHAQGALKGGHSQMLVAPPVSGGTLSIKTLLANGAHVSPGEVVVAFDTAAQEYNLTQAREALEQAQQQVLGAQATAAAQTEDDGYQLVKAGFDVARAKLKVRTDPIVAAITAKQNDLALAAAQAHLVQLQSDVADRKASNTAAVAVQQAAERKAQADASTAERNIASMTLRADHDGYVSIQSNTSSNIAFFGMVLPSYQAGDTTQPGQAVAEIPDTGSWEVDLRVAELDAGHLAPGQPVAIRFVALPGRSFAGRLQSVGATSGPAWNRQVACVVQPLDPSPAFRPGLSVNAVITTATLPQALWVPSQAVFEGGGGGSYVYLRRGGQFVRQNITVVERSESQVVLRGLQSGDVIALANPELGGAVPAAAAAKKPAGAAAALPGGKP